MQRQRDRRKFHHLRQNQRPGWSDAGRQSCGYLGANSSLQAFKNVEATTLKVSEWITYAQVVFTLGGSGAAVAISASNGSLGVNEALCVATESGANGIVNEKATWPQPGTNTPDGKHYAVLIDINGNIVGISSVSTVSGGAVSNGCWQSFGGMV